MPEIHDRVGSPLQRRFHPVMRAKLSRLGVGQRAREEFLGRRPEKDALSCVWFKAQDRSRLPFAASSMRFIAIGGIKSSRSAFRGLPGSGGEVVHFHRFLEAMRHGQPKHSLSVNSGSKITPSGARQLVHKVHDPIEGNFRGLRVILDEVSKFLLHCEGARECGAAEVDCVGVGAHREVRASLTPGGRLFLPPMTSSSHENLG
jgi:hypothetical protein